MQIYSFTGINMRLWNALLSADPVDLGAQSDLIGVPEPMSIEDVLAAPTAGRCACAMGWG